MAAGLHYKAENEKEDKNAKKTVKPNLKRKLEVKIEKKEGARVEIQEKTPRIIVEAMVMMIRVWK
jgi:hypothetical protein